MFTHSSSPLSEGGDEISKSGGGTDFLRNQQENPKRRGENTKEESDFFYFDFLIRSCHCNFHCLYSLSLKVVMPVTS